MIFATPSYHDDRYAKSGQRVWLLPPRTGTHRKCSTLQQWQKDHQGLKWHCTRQGKTSPRFHRRRKARGRREKKGAQQKWKPPAKRGRGEYLTCLAKLEMHVYRFSLPCLASFHVCAVHCASVRYILYRSFCFAVTEDIAHKTGRVHVTRSARQDLSYVGSVRLCL